MTTTPHTARTGGEFVARHLGPDAEGLARILDTIGVGSLDELAERAVPSVILDEVGSDGRAAGINALPEPLSEADTLAALRALADRNTVAVSMIGQGYYDTLTPPVLIRNIIESPAWYTGYTPYQPEISQGRLEALLNFQTMVSDLTGMDMANASMLDEGTAAAEAMTMLRRANRSSKSPRFAVDADIFPQTAAILATRAEPLGIELVTANLVDDGLPDGEFFGALVQTPGASGRVADVAPLIEKCHERGVMVAAGVDLLAATVHTPAGEKGADACFGTTQRFGVPMGFGGPHAGFLACRSAHARNLPGRLVGVSTDEDGRVAYRLALQTREQHIRREKATSNICTAQVLLAVLAAMYASYHGAEGLTAIARRVHAHAAALADGLRAAGVEVLHDAFFDTVRARVPGRADEVLGAAAARGVNLWKVDDDTVSVSCDEATTAEHVGIVLDAFGADAARTEITVDPTHGDRTSEFLQHEAFVRYRTETAMLRYLRALSDKDMALDRTMIPLGSCTMKLNATTEMEPITWPEFNRLHPFAPAEQTAGIRELIGDVEQWLVDITGYAAVSLQPNAGSQGEYAGLLAIREYHRSRGDDDRTVCLIPSSAHGTNAASAVMAGMKVVVVACRENGDVDVDDLRAKVDKHGSELAAIMITYPSTHGVYEHDIEDICAIVHDAGGQVYIDGANLNALVGVARPGRFGGDVSHLNLHKTFCIPHGGGGPGVGPVAVAEHLREFLPGHPHESGLGSGGAVSAAAFGSASILPITWAYIRMMGADGLRTATLTAIASANYLARRIGEQFPVLYSGEGGWVAHECILDLRPLIDSVGISIDDVAKRLADYGFHAPTMSFPVPNTLMVEPTESEDLAELDAFCEAMAAIRAEIDRVAAGEWTVEDNPLRGAPHTAESVSTDEWDHAYPRSVAGYPLGSAWRPKVWPAVRRIDGAHGDRNLVCSCPPLEAFAQD
ncbi:glycine dehydrogenase (aminomethyl-transferring) [Dietzia sp. HMSC21D01]|uniref:Glycine dehydrogenase (decarboxylating) n=1 Tax=Dietzia cinnamea TaxID=321318 RepID=A0AAW5QAJ0_9ACTN|nr:MULTISPECIES: aminomethyl-transferring glycine dehydrogenase [Dietzia]MCT1864462.1 aminomethyl-transferring glycine dehydrogenase [Dietzia cinnamea]MCT2030520.1 aminomethyl-transferring glycine dehydrogenase [Dietzia cinnamea]MCT2033488.1 aminomethyl-transferring glycine dehydrogenase [Dietzia cinnamea]MCT2076431.1 aminomethyl-transferring glycine dehydrogenase [Dietzia cinnamea]MCT2106709.1 aminomethyl-transferring glycine dehydrogenase [Dietzia cinnamea]